MKSSIGRTATLVWRLRAAAMPIGIPMPITTTTARLCIVSAHRPIDCTSPKATAVVTVSRHRRAASHAIATNTATSTSGCGRMRTKYTALTRCWTRAATPSKRPEKFSTRKFTARSTHAPTGRLGMGHLPRAGEGREDGRSGYDAEQPPLLIDGGDRDAVTAREMAELDQGQVDRNRLVVRDEAVAEIVVVVVDRLRQQAVSRDTEDAA